MVACVHASTMAPTVKSFDYLPIIFSMNGIRPEPRTALIARGEVSWEDQFGFAHHAPARIEDRSVSGVCIRVKEPIGVGSTVNIKWRWDGFSGITKYCREDQGEYVIGIQRFTKDLQLSAPRLDPWRELTTSTVAQRPTVENKIAPNDQEDSRKENAKPSPKPENVPVISTAPPPTAVPEKVIGRRTEYKYSSHKSQSKEAGAPRSAKSQTKQPSPEKRSTHMATKWLDTALGRQKQEAPNGNTNDTPVPGNHPPRETAHPENIHADAMGMGPVKSQGDLQSTEDIYRAAGIMNPRMGYSINKVVEMLSSEHIRGMPTDAKRAGILMALDAAGVSVDEVLSDARLRHDALDEYEAEQREHFEEYRARKIESNAQIQAEMDRISSQYQERIDRNLEEVTQEKATFTRWQTMKEQEAERMMEAVGLCSKSAASETSSSSALALREVDK